MFLSVSPAAAATSVKRMGTSAAHSRAPPSAVTTATTSARVR